jgi:single-stranded-DNA-specific exonuclease
MLEAGMLKRWRLRQGGAWSDAAVRDFARLLGVHPVVARLLAERGIIDPVDAEAFLKPRMAALHDPALMPGIVRAAQRVQQAIADGQPIVIYGDYDVDGVTASSILYHTLTQAGANVSTYVPHRIEEGYGLNCDAIAQLCVPGEQGKPLIISVDCGITAVEPAQVAKAAGVDLIITDHHEFNADALPDAYALVHPRLPNSDTTYPFGDLCGAGVAFKLAWQIAKVHCGSERVSDAFRDLLLDLLSLAALGTVADVVPLIGENRIITTYGLGQIKRTRFEGLNALIDAARLREEKVDSYHVGFVLGPRLNACGRMGHAKEAVHLLTKARGIEATTIAQQLTGVNDDRRATERRIFDEAREMVVAQGWDSPDRRAIVVGHEGWHQGVVGIVASRLVEAFGRPAIVLNVDNGHAHGSARSIDGFSIHEALAACSEHLTTFGGHDMAAGMRLESTRIDSLRDAIVAFANERITTADLTPIIEVDMECDLAAVDVPVVRQLDRLAPFGRSNPAPVLCVRNVRLSRQPQRMGGNGKHLSLMLEQQGQVRRAIMWQQGDMADELAVGQMLDVVFEAKVSTWQNNPRAEMHLLDVKVR